MATWYIDPVSGNDANSGADAAHPVKTLSSLGLLFANGDSVVAVSSFGTSELLFDDTYMAGRRLAALTGVQCKRLQTYDVADLIDAPVLTIPSGSDAGISGAEVDTHGTYANGTLRNMQVIDNRTNVLFGAVNLTLWNTNASPFLVDGGEITSSAGGTGVCSGLWIEDSANLTIRDLTSTAVKSSVVGSLATAANAATIIEGGTYTGGGAHTIDLYASKSTSITFASSGTNAVSIVTTQTNPSLGEYNWLDAEEVEQTAAGHSSFVHLGFGDLVATGLPIAFQAIHCTRAVVASAMSGITLDRQGGSKIPNLSFGPSAYFDCGAPGNGSSVWLETFQGSVVATGRVRINADVTIATIQGGVATMPTVTMTGLTMVCEDADSIRGGKVAPILEWNSTGNLDSAAAALDLSGVLVKVYKPLTVSQPGTNAVTIDASTEFRLMAVGATVEFSGCSIGAAKVTFGVPATDINGATATGAAAGGTLDVTADNVSNIISG